MLATLLYAWCLGIRSSRRIAKACEDQVPFRCLTGNIRPDHCAFARFRSRLMRKRSTTCLPRCCRSVMRRAWPKWAKSTWMGPRCRPMDPWRPTERSRIWSRRS
ncbi:transposase [uncultured Desulfobulbus sp.]|uniref:transposase n=1 Tax=uncultured Desulfobulbus sp. TaxID=239745 RepID=UPI00374D2B53